ncbi:DUF2478 domain-containing protein [Oryzibacter oryziterrae]|uniref:DUF2478 domain-containing protein n=1 Tax=Oryzibacter oryziterrae TaxID=2766474 RepID=UPI001F33F0B7|nr:DUF2478 domain-containing protein [Oryzibacter oryziterrae]
MTRRILDRFPAHDAASRLNAFELAAIVYDDGVSIDHLMCFFADELMSTNHCVGGLVQQPCEDPDAAYATLVDLMTREHFLFRKDHQLKSRLWSLDDRILDDARTRIRRSVGAATDLTFVPRFGDAEIAGGGLAECYGPVAAYGIPLLTAVHRRHVEDWLKFTGGIGTLLACRLRVLRDWWNETATRRQAVEARRQQEAADLAGATVIPFLPNFQ